MIQYMTTISKTANLVAIPAPGLGHLVPAVELAKHLVARDPHLSVTFLIIRLPIIDHKLESYLQSLHSSPSMLSHGLAFMDMPLLDDFHFDFTPSRPGFLGLYMEAYLSNVMHLVQGLWSSAAALPITGFLLDMFCTAMIDVAAELGLPSYIFFPSNASMLSMMFCLQELGVDFSADYDVVRHPDAAVEIPGFRNPVPVRVWPVGFLSQGGRPPSFLRNAERFRRVKGILVNTFSELERDVIHSMSRDSRIPPIYPVGPILNLSSSADGQKAEEDAILTWLDAQPPRSVVFLCFGSRGSFDETQLKEIAVGLELSGRLFLWSIRRRPESQGGILIPSEYDDPSSVLPEGFLERTAERGRVIGWAPQARVLGHVAIGGFVSHCGWNSTLESLWFGVPIATWPLYAEQQLNAFMLVREMGLAAEIKMDYRQYQSMAVEAAKVEEGVQKVMEDGELRKSVKEMSDKARKALGEGGSSDVSLGRFIDNLHHTTAQETLS